MADQLATMLIAMHVPMAIMQMMGLVAQMAIFVAHLLVGLVVGTVFAMAHDRRCVDLRLPGLQRQGAGARHAATARGRQELSRVVRGCNPCSLRNMPTVRIHPQPSARQHGDAGDGAPQLLGRDRPPCRFDDTPRAAMPPPIATRRIDHKVDA
jgi:hypothetical protein